MTYRITRPFLAGKTFYQVGDVHEFDSMQAERFSIYIQPIESNPGEAVEAKQVTEAPENKMIFQPKKTKKRR